MYDAPDPSSVDYWLWEPMTIKANGDQATAAALKKFADFLSTAKDACLKAGESQEQWLERQIQNWVSSNPLAGIHAHLVNTAMRATAAQNGMSPPPPSCVV